MSGWAALVLLVALALFFLVIGLLIYRVERGGQKNDKRGGASGTAPVLGGEGGSKKSESDGWFDGLFSGGGDGGGAGGDGGGG